MKNTLRMVVAVMAVTFFVGWVFKAQAQEEGQFVLEEDGPVRYVKPIVENTADGFAPAAVQHSLPYLASVTNEIKITSLCSVNSSSSNLAQSRRNAMAGLMGMQVNTNIADPAGWHLIPVNGWQWHDLITTTTSSNWRGFTNGLPTGLQGERKGNRVPVHLVYKGRVSAYQCRISSSLTNIQDVTFWVGKDSGTGSNLMYNANFIGFNPGPNGIFESTYNPAVGVATQRGDDIVYSNGEDPNNVSDDVVSVRFGASVSVTANTDIGMNMVKNQFIRTNQIFMAQLIKDGQVVNEKTVMSEMPTLTITTNSSSAVRIQMTAGQDFVQHNLQMATQLDGPWMTVNTNLTKNWLDASTYSSVDHPIHMGNEAVFFRLCTQ